MPKRTMQGTVVSDKADKTVTVRVERRIMHPVYKKIITKSKTNQSLDIIIIIPTRNHYTELLTKDEIIN